MLGLPIIESLEDFARKIHLSKGFLFTIAEYSHFYYRKYFEPKKSGGFREICQPSRKLKAVQAWILRNILDKLEVSSSCKGFVKNLSILDNASPHVNSSAFLTYDIEDFFPTITANKVHTIFSTLGYNTRIASLFTLICTCDGKLPQGSPASPKLANLTCLKLDARLEGFAGKYKIIYTRYADDLTFSAASSSHLAKKASFIKNIIQCEGFNINESKTRFSGPSRTNRVTGLVIDRDRVGIGRDRSRDIRAEIHRFWAQGSSNDTHFKRIQGLLAFLKSVDSIRAQSFLKYLSKFNSTTSHSRMDSLINLLSK